MSLQADWPECTTMSVQTKMRYNYYGPIVKVWQFVSASEHFKVVIKVGFTCSLHLHTCNGYVVGQNEIQVKMILTQFDSQFSLSSNPKIHDP